MQQHYTSMRAELAFRAFTLGKPYSPGALAAYFENELEDRSHELSEAIDECKGWEKECDEKELERQSARNALDAIESALFALDKPTKADYIEAIAAIKTAMEAAQ